MRGLFWMMVLASVFQFDEARAGSRVVEYGPPPAWIAAPPKPTETPSLPGAPMRFIFADWQVRIGPNGKETYTAYRVKLLTPQGLAAGNIAAAWDPSADDLIIHRLNIIRGDQVIDVLKLGRFQIIQRENNLEHAMLDGQLTATLQAPGLRVGDELDFAMTVRRRDPVLGDRAGDIVQLPTTTTPGAFRTRLIWPKVAGVQLRATPDLDAPTVSLLGQEIEQTYEVRDPSSVIMTDNAPTRYNLRRLIQFSSYGDWADISHQIAPLFDKASTLGPGSAVRAEAQRIAAATTDPVARTEAALALVQEQIRYVYVGLDGGNYRPAGADETWERRFGDCKAKTGLLLALLRELGVPAEAVLVNSNGGDGINEFLPMPQLFDHVLVRATIGGKVYWLDGTRPGDLKLSRIPAPPYRWVLPIRAGAVDLENVPPQPMSKPQEKEILRVDASAGFDRKARFDVRRMLHGDEAAMFHKQIIALAPEDITRGLTAYWRAELSAVEPQTVSWEYDAATNVLTLTMKGEGTVDWEGDERSGRSLGVYRSGFYPPDEMRRPAEQDQTAAWVVPDFPRYRCSTTLIKLPSASARLQWDYSAKPMNRRVGGTHYWREVGLRDGIMRVTRSTRIYTPELSAAEAKAAVDAIPTFDNTISRVFQRAATSNRKGFADPGSPVSWDGDYPCAPSDQAATVSATAH